jgi:hypothetical protein
MAMQLSLLPALEAESPHTQHLAQNLAESLAESLPNRVAPCRQPEGPLPDGCRPTSAQINYLKRLTGIRADGQLHRYVARKIGKQGLDRNQLVVSKQDFAQAIDRELNEKRWAA